MEIGANEGVRGDASECLPPDENDKDGRQVAVKRNRHLRSFVRQRTQLIHWHLHVRFGDGDWPPRREVVVVVPTKQKGKENEKE